MHGRLLCRALAAYGASRLTCLPAHAVCLSADARSPPQRRQVSRLFAERVKAIRQQVQNAWRLGAGITVGIDGWTMYDMRRWSIWCRFPTAWRIIGRASF